MEILTDTTLRDLTTQTAALLPDLTAIYTSGITGTKVQIDQGSSQGISDVVTIPLEPTQSHKTTVKPLPTTSARQLTFGNFSNQYVTLGIKKNTANL